MKVAAYQAPILACGSMVEELALLSEQVETFDLQGIRQIEAERKL